MSEYLQRLQRDPTTTAVKLPACVVIVLNEQAQLLLLKPKQCKHWQLPMDEIRESEKAAESTLRLARSQTGLALQELDCIGYSSAHPANQIQWPGAERPVQLHSFVMVSTDWEAELSCSDEFDAAQFYSIGDLPPVSDWTRYYIDMFKTWLPNREFQFY